MEVAGSSEPYLWHLIAISGVLLQQISVAHAFGLLAMVLLLACSALVSGAEIAFFSLGPPILEEIRSAGSKRGAVIIRLLEKPKHLLATILIANNLVNVAIVILSTYITVDILSAFRNPLVILFVQVVSVTFMLLLFGEIIPKVYAASHAGKIADFMAYPIMLLDKTFKPLSNFLVFSTSIIHNKFRKKHHNISVDELSEALELTDDGELVHEQEMLKGIVKFGNTDVKQVMNARVDVAAVEYNSDFWSLLDLIKDCGYSRIPVYKDSFDNISGILCIKDLLPHLTEKKNFAWQPLINPPFFVPENKKIDDLLKEMQNKKMHLAVVVDEYGGTSGIITLEDIIEEIIGDISDESDVNELVYSKLDEFNYVFEGKTSLNDVCKILKLNTSVFEEAKGDSDSLAGLVLELAGKIPGKNEKIRLSRFLFTIEAADERKVTRVKITISDN